MSPDQDDKPAASSLDAERERLRKAGYTDPEISQILIAQAAQQPAGAAGQGVMSNALSSIVAVGSHARSVIPSFRKDVATIFDGAATASARAGATASLVVKAVVILVLGYAAWQEWNQHIISATAIADAEVRKRHAEECLARQKLIVNSMPAPNLGLIFGDKKKDEDKPSPYAQEWARRRAEFDRDCVGIQ
jgi:hypothetical protein